MSDPEPRTAAPAPGLRPPTVEAAEPTAAAPTYNAPPQTMPIEAQLVRLGLLTVGQLAEAHRQRLETGRPVLEIALEKGWLSAEQLAELTGETATAPATAPVAPAAPAPEPVAPTPEPEAAIPEPEPETEPPPPAAAVLPETSTATFTVFLQLTDGELVEVGRAEGEQRAEAIAREVVAEITRSGAGKWPYYGRRFIRPEAITSVALVEGELTES